MAFENEVGTAEQSTDDEEVSLRDTLDAAFKEAGAETQGESINTPRERGEDGKFKAREKVADVAAEPVSDLAAASAHAAAEPVAEPAGPAVQPPAAWSAEAKAEWTTLSPKAQKIIADREAEVHRGFTRLDEERNLGKSIKEVLTPYMATINALGATPQQAVQSLFNADHVLRNGSPQAKTQLMANLASQFGVDLSQVVAGAPAPDRTVQELQQQVWQLTEFISNQQRTALQSTQQTLQSEIQAFAADKPHFETLKPAMAALMDSGQASSLQDAYDQAFRAHPTTHSLWLEGEVAKRAKSEAEAAKARVAKARGAAVSVSGAPGANSSPSRAQPDSLHDALAAQFREAGFRV